MYDEEKEKEWRSEYYVISGPEEIVKDALLLYLGQHRENVRRNYYEERKKEKEKIESEEEVWTMLDKLEQNEREQNELLK